MAEKSVVGGIPVECLTGESAVIWSGWRTLGDREVVREASAKGTHINLAHKHLAYRRNCSIDDAQQYFNNEVEIWITELLKKRQIYRASHVLNNMKKDPIEYIFNICISCKDSMLRNYLAEYLISVEHFETEYINSWNIIKSITEFEQKYMIENGISTSLSIQDVIKLPEIVKQSLCTELYFSITNHTLSTNITNDVLWNYLLSNNKIEMIQFWIDSYYGDNVMSESIDINDDLKSLFTSLNITSDMIESIDSSNASSLVKDLTKNHLCRYGIFLEKERQDIKLMLGRIFSNAMTLSEFNKVLLHKSCNINRTEFMQNVEKELCLAHCLNETSTQEDKVKIGELYDALTKMCEGEEQCEDMLIEGIFKTIHYFADDVDEYLKQNYLIVLVLIFSYLSKESKINQNKNTEMKESILQDIFLSKNNLQLGSYSVSNDVLQNTLKHVPLLERVVENKPKKETTMYELLDGYKNLNTKQLFKWRFNDEPMPHFSNDALIKKYGYTESLTYEYYLKEARPTMAIFSLKHSQGKLIGNIFSRRKYKAALYAHIFALQNLDKSEILCTCISFIEMLGVDSENLRLHITAANYVQREMNISIGNLLENIVYKNEDDLKTVMSHLENSFKTNFTENIIEDSQQFVKILKIWDVIVRFARAHNFPLPVSLLTFLANHNYWFEFTLVSDIFAYPLDQVLENAKYMEDTILGEHLLTCLSNTHLTKCQSAVCSEHKVKSRDVRQSLYYKIGVKQSGSSISDSSASIDSLSTSDSRSLTEYPLHDNICAPNDDLWLIILKCHQSPDPPGALINASRLTSRPFLTILATCYEPSSTAAFCYSWMVISTADEDILSKYKECLEQQIWTANQVFHLLIKMLTCGYISTLSRAYKIFMPYRSKFKYCAQKNDNIDDKFWSECAQNFEKYDVPCEKSAEFFIEHAEKVISHKERYEILKLAFETLKNVETEQQNINALEVAMWKSCILAGPENIQLDNESHSFNKLKTELLSGLNKLKLNCVLNDSHEKTAAKNLIDKLIDLGKLDTALRISTIFNCKHKDLQNLMLCLRLAEGEISPNELTVEQKDFLKDVNKNKQQKYGALKNRGLQRLSSSSSLTTSTSTSEINKIKDENIYKVQIECLSTLQKLLETLEHGANICLKVVLCYKLAMQLGKSYQLLLKLNNPIQFLQEVAESDIEDKSEVISDIITAYKISNNTIAKFLAENITMKISCGVEGGYEDNIYLWGYSLNTNFRIIMELCSDVSLLGWQLLKTANKLLGHFHNEIRNESTLKTTVELLIRVHDCFTTSCNMEGIASVLRKCQNLANVLQNLKFWTLLVRLVTGVGRYTEMSYVFQILKENDQFEFLLGKGLDKGTGLKTALLEFLKRHCPENKDLFTLVALHFQLYHEIALMWENEAKDVVKSLIADATKEHGKLQGSVQHEIKFTKTETVQKQLQLAVTNYTHATQYYLQANKLNFAGQCSDQEQLVALQLSLLNSVSYNQQVISILNLKSEDIDKVLCHILSFSQALIVIRAYNHHVDWVNLIYNHCILNGETKYLRDFIAVNKLTTNLVQDCTRRYRLEKSITHTMTDNMKILISELSDVECKYVLASQLGFKDIVETMLNNPMIGAYLKDTVWKRKYNTT
ncbi:spatacsin isoform X4 [Megachile rotundata]|uniref:spatacsin isoform X4 n=1 Tax=Megachile rotundata TaxID=143995 RepID=UPI003FD3C799